MFARTSITLFFVATEVLLSSNLFLMFLSSITVQPFVLLTWAINHVRMFHAVRAQRNKVLGVTDSNQQRDVILRREKKVAYHLMILIAALLICSVPSWLLKAFQSSFIEKYRYLLPWAMSFAFINASVNSIINFWWNRQLQNVLGNRWCLVEVQALCAPLEIEEIKIS